MPDKGDQMDTLHPGTGRVIQRIQKELGEADSENL